MMASSYSQAKINKNIENRNHREEKNFRKGRQLMFLLLLLHLG
jgi:hypothetical protein